MEKDKVFCKDCRWYRCDPCLLNVFVCKHPTSKMEKETPFEIRYTWMAIWDKNRNNDCKYFEEKTWSGIKRKWWQIWK